MQWTHRAAFENVYHLIIVLFLLQLIQATHFIFPPEISRGFHPTAVFAQEPVTNGGLPAGIGVGRTLSSFTVDGAQNNQLTITYSVFNLQTQPVNEILLVTTLELGVSLQTATPTPDRNGQELAFVLPSIPPFGEVTATLTVGLPPGPGPLVVDNGVRAFGNLRTRAVEASIGPTTLKDTLGVSAAFLRSTIDADTSDRFVLQKTGEVGCDPVALFAFVRDEIGYEVYRGSLRGARGTLWSHAGNALDQASLLVALLRTCGIPSRYVSGTLDVPLAQELILSMFEPVSRAVGGLAPAALPAIGDATLNELLLHATQFMPGANELSDPANDPELLGAARQHFWVEHFDGTSFVALDPTFRDAQVGQTFALAASTFIEVDDAIRHKVQFQLDVERMQVGGVGGLLMGVAGELGDLVGDPAGPFKRIGSLVIEEKTVLAQTFRTTELVGRPVSIGHFVDQSGVGAGITVRTNTYSPWLQVGENNDLLRGTDYDELLSSLGSNLVVGVFLRMTTINAQGNEEKFERALVDRIGFPIRQGESGAINLDQSQDPVFSDLDIITVGSIASLQDPGRAEAERHLVEEFLRQINQLEEAAAVEGAILARLAIIAYERALISSFVTLSNRAELFAEGVTSAKAYLAAPALTVSGLTVRLDGEDATFKQFIDLKKHNFFSVAAPGSRLSSAFMLRAMHGLSQTRIESSLLGEDTRLGAIPLLEAAAEQGIPLEVVGARNPFVVDALILSDEARSRIRSSIASGRVILVPSTMVLVNGRAAIAWLELNPETGDLIGVTEDGGHAETVEYVLHNDGSITVVVKTGGFRGDNSSSITKNNNRYRS